jgi:ubiquinone/menaquinone biosynthesis C-methylase UbiE
MTKPLATYPIKTFDDFRNVVQLHQYSRIIMTALELDLFTAIGSRTSSVAALASKLNVSARGLAILCRNLAALGLLNKRGNTYRNSPLARVELNRKSSSYRGEYLDLVQTHRHDYEQLTASVRTGTPIDLDQDDDPKSRRSFTWAMHHRSREQARQVARRLNLGTARTLLDLGGGPGTYAIAFLAHNRSLRATVADRPAALKVAQEIAASHPGRSRLSFAAVDFMKDPLPGRFDVVWVSNIIHIYSPDENQALLKKIARTLNPGGRVLIQDAFLRDSEGLYPIDTTAFAVTMLLFTEHGNTYSVQAVREWLKRAGYRDVQELQGPGARKDGENGLVQGRVKKTARHD